MTRWVHSTKMDLQERGREDMDTIRLEQDMVNWLAVLNIGIHYCDDSMNHLITISVLRN